MPPAVDRSPNNTSSPLSGRKLISRIASPFATKSRTFTDFCIDIDEPHRQYQPGDTVGGSVRLRVLKPIRVTHIAVCLHGFVQVYKTPGSPGEGYRANNAYLGAGRGKKSGEYFGNGFASLFEDEVVLCGDGRLAEGSYQFNFELEFPDRDLPSSIDFERGTISYMITATMTRPTTLMPTVTCDHTVYFVERIDISRLYPPKPRTITLEPVSKRARTRSHARKLVDATGRRSRKVDSTQQTEQSRESRASSMLSIQAETETPISPAPSELSLETETSSSEQLSRRLSGPESHRSPTPDGANISKTLLQRSPRTITAAVESLTGGCLRGDHVCIKVSVNHTKAIRSLYGVIVTLYRHARVDLHPAIPLGPTEKGAGTKYEDYYPKSLTGLGGLSLSGAGSSHVFRKDLSQVLAPLYVDPTSLTAELNPKVRVPDEAFPTISTVPGGMISFKYYVEVVLDIQGKLGNSDRSLGNLGGLSGMPSPTAGIDGLENERSASTPYGSNIIDTAPIRRDKGVVTCTFEVIVGTRDSERRKGKRRAEPLPEDLAEQRDGPEADVRTDEGFGWHDGDETYQGPPWYHQQHHLPQPMYYAHAQQIPSAPTVEDHAYHTLPIAMPQPEDESQLSEKERIRRAEMRLLPSQPPLSEHIQEDASAPYLPDEGAVHAEHGTAASAPAYEPDLSPALLPSSRGTSHAAASPLYPVAESGPSTEATATASDDKQELERQRLQAQASAPAEEEVEDLDTSTASPALEPSAPSLDEAESYAVHDSHADAAGSSGLPRYER